VTDALLRLHDGKWNFLMHGKLAVLKEIHFRNKLGTLTINDNKHGGCREIPRNMVIELLCQQSVILLIIMFLNTNLAGGNEKNG
jgi:hypothetical protein